MEQSLFVRSQEDVSSKVKFHIFSIVKILLPLLKDMVLATLRDRILDWIARDMACCFVSCLSFPAIAEGNKKCFPVSSSIQESGVLYCSLFLPFEVCPDFYCSPVWQITARYKFHSGMKHYDLYAKTPSIELKSAICCSSHLSTCVLQTHKEHLPQN